jgi:hypothetical protein
MRQLRGIAIGHCQMLRRNLDAAIPSNGRRRRSRDWRIGRPRARPRRALGIRRHCKSVRFAHREYGKVLLTSQNASVSVKLRQKLRNAAAETSPVPSVQRQTAMLQHGADIGVLAVEGAKHGAVILAVTA